MRTFYIIALLLWIAGTTYWSNKTFCGDKAKKPSADSAVGSVQSNTGDCDLSLIFEDNGFEAQSEMNFFFRSSETKFKPPSDQLATVLNSVSNYLNENQDRSLLLEGIYFEKETNNSSSDNLGIGRAAALKTYLIREYDFDADQLKVGGRLSTDLKCFYNKDNNLINKGVIASFGEK